jgi:hypothetical protein
VVWALSPFSVTGVTDDLVREFGEHHGVTFPIMRDPGGTYGQYDDVGSTAPFPLDVIVDQQGIVQYVDTRFEPEVLHDVIDGLLAR